MQIPRYASLRNDDDYDSDNKALMPMQDDDDLSIQTMDQIVVWITFLTRIGDDRGNETLHEE